ncbi:hypothetical protein EBZ70_00670 [bacterium]|nr:hypothetical protein [bacterium]
MKWTLPACLLVAVVSGSGALRATEPPLTPVTAQLSTWLNAKAEGPVRVWDPGSEPTLALTAESDRWRLLPKPGLVQLLVHAADAEAGGRLQITLGKSGRPPTPVSLRIPGWQRITIAVPLEDWKDGDPGVIQVSASGKTGPIQFAGPSHPAWPVGPGLSDAQLLAMLDLERPELSGVRAAVLRGDITEARRELIRHFRGRTQPTWQSPPREMTLNEKEDLAALAAMNLAGEFAMLGHRHTYPEGAIDWHLDPTEGTNAQTNEWVWSISRHEFASRWKYGLEASGDARYPAAWGRTILGWTEAMPVPASNWSWPGSGWRVLEAGIRTGEFWPDAWAAFHAHPAFSDDALLAMVKSFWEHADFLAAKPPFTGNFYVLANCGLHTTATLFPEFRDSPSWRKTAVLNLEKCVVPNTGSDGGWFEASPSYHQWVVDKLALVLSCAERNGCASDFSPSFRSLLSRMAEWNVRVSTPDRRVTALNDSSRLTLASVTTPFLREVYPGSNILPWAAALASGAAPGPNPPLPASEYLEPSGYMVMRTSWEKDASYLLFDVGPMGGGHGHFDALNLVYSPDGRRGLFDGTGGTYDKTPFRWWSMSTLSHNTITIDRLNQFRPKPTKDDPIGALPADTPAPVYSESLAYIYASGWHVGGYGREPQLSVRHRREIVFLKETGIVLVLDTLTPADDLPHAYDLRWHAATTQAKHTADGVALCGEEGSPLLAILPLTGLDSFHADSGVTKPEILGWDVIKGGTWDKTKSGPPVPALTVRHLRKTSGPTTFATLLVPPSQFIESGAEHRITHTTTGSASVTLGGKRWEVSWGTSPNAPIMLSGFSPLGTLEVPRNKTR